MLRLERLDFLHALAVQFAHAVFETFSPLRRRVRWKNRKRKQGEPQKNLESASEKFREKMRGGFGFHASEGWISKHTGLSSYRQHQPHHESRAAHFRRMNFL